ncbi:MAG: phosphoribosylanthranilate isomerase [Candidatus Omnitrophica bacterium]|nr:phosphoribosylanthranilate isomerase [Candidatus Omnitrophota bacterium]
MVKVKICGITNLEDAQVAVKAGCDALGFVFYKKSPRYISPQKAAEIVKALDKKIAVVGVFVNSRKSFIEKVAKTVKLTMIQLHGNESVDFCRRLSNFNLIKAFRVSGQVNFKELQAYPVKAWLFDSFSSCNYGGTGKTIDWQKLADCLAGSKKTIFLAGGLTANNVVKAISIVKPQWVDASSGLELFPGKKDHRKVKAFLKVIRQIKKFIC